MSTEYVAPVTGATSVECIIHALQRQLPSDLSGALAGTRALSGSDVTLAFSRAITSGEQTTIDGVLASYDEAIELASLSRDDDASLMTNYVFPAIVVPTSTDYRRVFAWQQPASIPISFVVINSVASPLETSNAVLYDARVLNMYTPAVLGSNAFSNASAIAPNTILLSPQSVVEQSSVSLELHVRATNASSVTITSLSVRTA
jgi:hypothetical protein